MQILVCSILPLNLKKWNEEDIEQGIWDLASALGSVHSLSSPMDCKNRLIGFRYEVHPGFKTFLTIHEFIDMIVEISLWSM